MEKIGIVIDQAADLPKELIEQKKIKVVDVKLDWPEIQSLPGNNTFQKMRELEKMGIKSFGKTSQPSPKAFLEQYKAQFANFDKVLSIDLTSKLSGTYNSAVQAKNFLTPEQQSKVSIIDTLSCTSGQALFVLKAIDSIEAGKNMEEIVKEMEAAIPAVRCFVAVEDPKWLEAAGRISSLAANILRRMAQANIRPLLAFKNGSLVPAGIKTNAKDMPTMLYKQLQDDMKKFNKENKKIRVVITHGDDPLGANRLKEMVETEMGNAQVSFINIINDIVGSIAGPNTLSVAWIEV